MNEGFRKDQIDNLQNRELIYVKKFNRFVSDIKIYSDILSLLRIHNFNNFKIVDKGYCTEITPDDIFLELISKLNTHLEVKINLDRIIIFISHDKNNLIDIDTHLPDILKGCSIGYKLYKLVIRYYGWISSNKAASDDAINLWYNLIQDDDLYCITSNYFSYAIDKKISDNDIKDIFVGIKKRNEIPFDQIQFDDDLKSKIDELS
jgi:hypothetical protein